MIYDTTLDDNQIKSLYTNSAYIKTIYDTITTEVFDTTFTEVFDTTYVTTQVFDTTYVAVTDTLIIDIEITDYAPPHNINSIKVYPNPAKDHLYINTGHFGLIYEYQIRIINQTGVTMFETYMQDFQYEINLSTWTGKGLYYLQLIDPNGNIVDVKKIILQ